LNELRLKAYTQNISRDVENRIAPNLAIFPSSENITSGAKITTDWDFYSLNHRVITGIEGWQRKTETKRARVTELEENKFQVVREQPVPNATMLNLGAFAQHSWRILPFGHHSSLSMNTGFRFDYIQVKNDTAFNPMEIYRIEDGKKIDIDFERKELFPAGTKNEFSYSAHIDFVYEPVFPHQFVLSLSNAYRAASLEERFKYIDLGNVLQVGNPNLKPEQGFFSNLSYQFQPLRKLTLKADIFANYLFNLITATYQRYEKPNGEIVNNALVNTNIDEALFLGAEIDVFYWINSSFWIAANAGYTYARDVKKNEYLPQIPPLKGMLELNYRIKNLLTTSVSTNFAAKQWQTAKNEQQTDGYIVLNAAARSERIAMKSTYLQFFAGVDNIFNTAYYNHLRTTRLGYAQAEPGRNFYVKAQFGW
jgi:outer membrane receptor protein involved in Fe transport